jgi:uncharacterized protein YjiS (DUF1127 family)
MACIAENPKATSHFLPLGFAEVAGWLAGGASGIARVVTGRRVLRELASFDDRMLKDIGLTRSDLRNAAAEPLLRDPTALLAGRVSELRLRHSGMAPCRHRPRRFNVLSY